MIKRILGGFAVALATSSTSMAQVPGFAPDSAPGTVVTADAPARAERGARLGRPIVFASAQEIGGPLKPALTASPTSDIIPTKADLGATPIETPMSGIFGSTVGGGDACCDPCQVCGPNGRVWASFEWLYWVASGQSIPALATSAPVGTPLSTAGVGGQSTTTTLFGNQRVNNDWRNGFRATAGMWLDPEQTRGIELDFFFLGRSSVPFGVGSDGSQIITRPFFNASTGARDTELVSFPGIVAGTTTADPRNSVIGGGINFLQNLCCNPCGRTDLIVGYRYLNVGDNITITENLTALGGSNVPAGTTFAIRDRFGSSNNFNGALIGIAHERRFNRFYVNVRTSVALGDNYQITRIDGSTTITPPGGLPTTYPGGLLAQPTNMGTHTSNNFAVMPEVGVKLGMQVTENARVFVGYNFIYLSNVTRAGDQISTSVNTSLLPPSSGLVGSPAPIYQQRTTDFWLQGVSLGAELRF